MDPQLVAKTWVYDGLCDLYFGFDKEDKGFEGNARFSEIMGLEKFLKAALLFHFHGRYEGLPQPEAKKMLNKLAKKYGHDFKKMMGELSKIGLNDIDQIKKEDFDGYSGSALICAVTAGYMETRYPVPKPISDEFPIGERGCTRDPLSSSGIRKFIHAVCNACFHMLSEYVDFKDVRERFRETFSDKESFRRFNNLFWEPKCNEDP
jgi:hypothetical protein